ncbi:hypothetical protein BaRGS_00031753, partial [Batillaria attramentaria]
MAAVFPRIPEDPLSTSWKQCVVLRCHAAVCEVTSGHDSRVYRQLTTVTQHHLPIQHVTTV